MHDDDDAPPPLPAFSPIVPLYLPPEEQAEPEAADEVADPENPEPENPDAENPHTELETEPEQPVPAVADQWLPKNQLHLLAGPTHAGKSTLAAQLVAAIVRDNEWFGLVPPYFSGGIALMITDRPWHDAGHWYRTMGLKVPYWSMLDHEPESLIKKFGNAQNIRAAWIEYVMHVVDERLNLPADSLLLLDVINPIVGGDINAYNRVFTVLADLNRYLAGRKVTCIGVAHAGKVKSNVMDRYARAIDRVAGSAAFLGASGTAMHLAVEEEVGVEGLSQLTVIPRKQAPTRIFLVRGERGVFVVPQSHQITPKQPKEVSLFRGIDEKVYEAVMAATREDIGRELRWRDIRAIVEEIGIKSSSTLALAVKQLVEAGKVAKVKRGVYSFGVAAKGAS